jgi:hypothetical protein
MSTAGLNIREDLKWDMYAKLHSGKWQNWRDTLLTIEWFFKMYVLCVSILKPENRMKFIKYMFCQ